jgi:hypothetical protein
MSRMDSRLSYRIASTSSTSMRRGSTTDGGCALHNEDPTEASKRVWRVGHGEGAASSNSCGSALTCAVLAWGPACLRRLRLRRGPVAVRRSLFRRTASRPQTSTGASATLSAGGSRATRGAMPRFTWSRTCGPATSTQATSDEGDRPGAVRSAGHIVTGDGPTRGRGRRCPSSRPRVRDEPGGLALLRGDPTHVLTSFRVRAEGRVEPPIRLIGSREAKARFGLCPQ